MKKQIGSKTFIQRTKIGYVVDFEGDGYSVLEKHGDGKFLVTKGDFVKDEIAYFIPEFFIELSGNWKYVQTSSAIWVELVDEEMDLFFTHGVENEVIEEMMDEQQAWFENKYHLGKKK